MKSNPGQTAGAITSSAQPAATPRRCESFAAHAENPDGSGLFDLYHPVDRVSSDDNGSDNCCVFGSHNGSHNGSPDTVLNGSPAPEWDALLRKAVALQANMLVPPVSKTLKKTQRFEVSMRSPTPVTNNTTKKRKQSVRSDPDAALINHRIATAKRSRTNGRFQKCQIVWVNVSPLGEMMDRS